MKHFSSQVLRRTRGWVAAGLVGVIAVAACSRDGGSGDAPTPTPPLAAPTPYALVLPSNFPGSPLLPADNPLTVEGVDLGRHLFYEKTLSVDNSISCASCHRQSLAFTDGLAHAVGVNGAKHPRSAMALSNLLWDPLLTWDGTSAGLETQARTPLTNDIEMHQTLAASVAKLQAQPAYVTRFAKAFGAGALTEDNMLKALSQFVRTLVSGNSRYDRYRRGDRSVLSADEVRGLQLFITHPTGTAIGRGGNCADCHAGDLQTNHLFVNNGLDRTFPDLGRAVPTGLASDQGKFRIPSLRNIALTGPYMHDGRFTTLEDVLAHYNEHIEYGSPNLDPNILNGTNSPLGIGQPLGLTDTEKKQIVLFLRTLTDSTFIQDPRFSQPTD
ncbi:cytochrome-c peroxidase [Hymenobacter sp. PAMC 26628]|uniref:cytochrome-c peroxidase n=1 Tax=Hymenobacter sp. PAMC 26628 TaxID=1484118 RepID=UPI00076FF705|nr:cytochrome c peroxidase [Hymenobacter sp. PAMC 26628]AMJ66241.1 hypothetical protein AXW84_12940 [Hymenobacter sp. PAMC 26628]